jgi:diguanylate cyclase (GGDEF)-like protein/PAS domain S-box-containing protein
MGLDPQAWHPLLERLYDGVCIVDARRGVVGWNAAAQQITGYAADEVVGREGGDDLLAHVTADGAGLDPDDDALAATLRDGVPREGDFYVRHRNGHRLPIRARTTAVRDETGAVVGALEVFSDITPRAVLLRQAEELAELELVDPLTGVGSRRLVTRVLERRLDELGRHGVPFGVALLDLDRLKLLNDGRGHEIGDHVLQMVARTLFHGVRSGFDSVCRWSGDEFLVVLRNVSVEQLTRIAEKLRFLVERSGFATESGLVAVTTSIGATRVAPDDTLADLLRRVEDLVHRSKHAGGNRVTLDAQPPALPDERPET